MEKIGEHVPSTKAGRRSTTKKKGKTNFNMHTVKADRRMSHPTNYKKFQALPAKRCAPQPSALCQKQNSTLGLSGVIINYILSLRICISTLKYSKRHYRVTMQVGSGVGCTRWGDKTDIDFNSLCYKL